MERGWAWGMTWRPSLGSCVDVLPTSGEGAHNLGRQRGLTSVWEEEPPSLPGSTQDVGCGVIRHYLRGPEELGATCLQLLPSGTELVWVPWRGS